LPDDTDKYLSDLYKNRIEVYGDTHPYTMNLLLLYSKAQYMMGLSEFTEEEQKIKSDALSKLKNKGNDIMSSLAEITAMAEIEAKKSCTMNKDIQDKINLIIGEFIANRAEIEELMDKYSEKAYGWFQKAVKGFQAAADQGYTDAKAMLGFCYYFGRGIEKNENIAVELLQIAAEQDHKDAQILLGIFYSSGNVLNRDTNKAFKWFQNAANHSESAKNLRDGLLLIEILSKMEFEEKVDFFIKQKNG
jgi:TPR repeat protein